MNARDIAKMIDHSILHPAFTDEDLKKYCELALHYDTASVCVKPYHVKLAAKLVTGTNVAVCAVIGFPHGNNSTAIKTAEALQVIHHGATEVDMVINVGKVIQGDWIYVLDEIEIIQNTCQKNTAILKVIFETDFLPTDDCKIKLCEICNKFQVAFVKTSTGYGFSKGKDGTYAYQGATEHDIILMRKHCLPEIKIKASGGVRTLDQLLRFHELGATRFGSTATETIMEEALKRFQK